MRSLDRLRNWLAPPLAGARRAALAASTLQAVALTIACAGALWIPMVLRSRNPLGWQLAVTVGAVALSLAALGLARAGKVRAGSLLMVAAIWTALTLGIVFTGTVREAPFAGYVIGIVAAGLLLGGRAAIATAALSAASGALFTFFWHPTPLSSNSIAADYAFGVHVLFFSVCAALLVLATQRIGGALDSAERNETSLARRNRELEVTRDRMRALTEGSRDLIAEIDEGGTFVYVSPNAKDILGWSPDQMVGEDVFARVHPEDRVGAEPALASLPRIGFARLGPLRHRGVDDGWHWLEAEANLFRTELGQIHAMLVARDVTERRELEEQLRQSQKLEALGRLAGGVAHDFNNLLTVISGHSEVMLEDPQLETETRESVGEIHDAARRAATLTRQLLAFGRKQVLQPRVVDVNQVVLETEQILRRLLGEDVELATCLWPEPTWIHADPSQLEQIIVNLAVNARDAMPGGGSLRIETSMAPGDEPRSWISLGEPARHWVRLTVRDAGVGMSADTLSRAFEPFFTTKEPGKGTGLGLPMVHGIVRQSGGLIDVETAPNAGTCVRVYLLPAVAEPPGLEETAVEPEPPPSRTGTVLVVEDEPALRNLVRDVLTRAGYRVLHAADGVEALAVARAEPGRIDLLLSDVVMPQMAGPALRARLLEPRPELRCLFMSGYADHPGASQPALGPGDPLLTKPFTPNELLRRVREILAPAAERRPS